MSHRILLFCGVALVALGASLGAVAAISDVDDTGPPPELIGYRMPEGFRAPAFTLSDQEGHDFSLGSTRGRVVAMTFVYSRCTSACPITLQTIRGALDDLESSRDEVDVLAITVDPEADTPRSVQRFLREQRVGDFVRYLTGPRARMRPIWKAYGIQPQGKGQEDHSAFVLLVDRRGFLRVGAPAQTLTVDELANDLQVLTDEQA